MNVIQRDSARSELMLSRRDVMTAENAPLLLTKSTRGGSVIVRYSRVERWDVIDERRGSVWRSPANLPINLKVALVALGGMGIGAALVLAFSGSSTVPVKAADASVALSPVVAEIPAIATPVRAVALPVAKAPPPRIVTVARAATAAPVAAAAVPAAAIERPAGPDSESAALAQAFSTDEAVSWRSTTGTGTVVVGAATIENGKYCRDVAVLTRTEGAADRTVNGRKCLEPGGRIADQAAPTPQ